MKRVLIALVAIAFVVAAIGIARDHAGEDIPAAKPSATDDSRVDVTRPFDRELTTDQIKQQSEQLLRAQEDLKSRMDEYLNGESHTLIVTIREERPGRVWIVAKVNGKPVCVTPPQDAPTYVLVTPLGADLPLATEVAPVEATLLKNGACQVRVELVVPRQGGYQITVVTADRNSFGGIKVGHEGEPQKVTFHV